LGMNAELGKAEGAYPDRIAGWLVGRDVGKGKDKWRRKLDLKKQERWSRGEFRKGMLNKFSRLRRT